MITNEKLNILGVESEIFSFRKEICFSGFQVHEYIPNINITEDKESIFILQCIQNAFEKKKIVLTIQNIKYRDLFMHLLTAGVLKYFLHHPGYSYNLFQGKKTKHLQLLLQLNSDYFSKYHILLSVYSGSDKT